MAEHTGTVREIVRTLGGAKAIAERFRVSEAAVFNWIMKGGFPATKSWDLHAFARERGFHLDPRDVTSFRPLTEDAA